MFDNNYRQKKFKILYNMYSTFNIYSTKNIIRPIISKINIRQYKCSTKKSRKNWINKCSTKRCSTDEYSTKKLFDKNVRQDKIFQKNVLEEDIYNKIFGKNKSK